MTRKKLYIKEALNIVDQIKLLKKRGLIVHNEEEIKHYLNNISYYHLSAYFKPYQNSDDSFLDKTTLNTILDLYFFDRKLRLLFTDALERIEKSFKTQFIYHLSLKYGSHCLTKNRIFEKHKTKIDDCLKYSKEPFLREFSEKYSNEYPPLWMLSETLSFGDILNIYSRSLEKKEKREIARYYDIHWRYLYSWLENLREIRNICAHYSRLWNKKITKYLKQTKEYEYLQYNGNIFDSIIITAILLRKVSPTYKWLEEITKLIKEYSIKTHKMGFPSEWEEIFKNIQKL